MEKQFSQFMGEAKGHKCPAGEYWCYTDKKCKKIPSGYHIGARGYLVHDHKHNGNGKNGNGNGNGSHNGNGSGNGNGGSGHSSGNGNGGGNGGGGASNGG